MLLANFNMKTLVLNIHLKPNCWDHLILGMDLSILAIGQRIAKDKVEVFFFGRMAQNSKEIGQMTWLTGKAD